MAIPIKPLRPGLEGAQAWQNLFQAFIEPVFGYVKSRVPPGLELSVNRKAGNDWGVLCWQTAQKIPVGKTVQVSRYPGQTVGICLDGSIERRFAPHNHGQASRHLAEVLIGALKKDAC